MSKPKWIFACMAFLLYALPAFAQQPCESNKPSSPEKCRPAAADTATPTQKIRQLQDLVTAKVNKNMTNAQKQAFLDSLHEYFDFSTMAEAALFGEWEKRSVEERARFTVAFTAMLQRNYLKRLYGHADYTVTITGEKIKEDKAQVNTRLTRNSRTAAIDVAYRLQKTKSGWRIYDVLTDDVSLVRNYRSMFFEILKNKGFSGLMEHVQSQASGPLP